MATLADVRRMAKKTQCLITIDNKGIWIFPPVGYRYLGQTIGWESPLWGDRGQAYDRILWGMRTLEKISD